MKFIIGVSLLLFTLSACSGYSNNSSNTQRQIPTYQNVCVKQIKDYWETECVQWKMKRIN